MAADQIVETDQMGCKGKAVSFKVWLVENFCHFKKTKLLSKKSGWLGDNTCTDFCLKFSKFN